MQSSHADGAGGGRQDNWLERVEDVREYDVPYHQRVAIDTGRRVGKWYTVKEEGAKTIIDEMADRKAFADPRVYAFDIECCKQPLKFPCLLILILDTYSLLQLLLFLLLLLLLQLHRFSSLALERVVRMMPS